MERFCKVGQPIRLTANNYFNPPLGTNFFRKAPADDAEFKAGILPELIHLVVVRGRRSSIAVLSLARRGSVRTSI